MLEAGERFGDSKGKPGIDPQHQLLQVNGGPSAASRLHRWLCRLYLQRVRIHVIGKLSHGNGLREVSLVLHCIFKLPNQGRCCLSLDRTRFELAFITIILAPSRAFYSNVGSWVVSWIVSWKFLEALPKLGASDYLHSSASALIGF
jgi:hypothetical protein